MSEESPVELAEQLLQLVKARYQSATSFQDSHENKNRIISLCDEMKRVIIGPSEYTVLLAESCQESSALRIISELGVADIVGDRTVSLHEISVKTGIDSRYLQIALSCLLAHGYFEEVGNFDSGLFRNNAMSNVLRTSHTGSLKEAIGFICDEGFKSTSYLLEAAKASAKIRPDPECGMQAISGARLAFGFDGYIFHWMASPEQARRGRRMGKAMQQLHRIANGGVISGKLINFGDNFHFLCSGSDMTAAEFRWNDFQSPIVDIGGGIGSLEISLLKAYPESPLKFVIFDIPETIQNAEKHWDAEMSTDARASVEFVSGNFLAASAEKTKIPKGRPTYIIRHILHDWTDEQVIIILKNVRATMFDNNLNNGTTAPKLLLCEMFLTATSSRFVRTTSMQILALNNGMTRTQKDTLRLLADAGFRVIKVHPMSAADTIIEAEPNL